MKWRDRPQDEDNKTQIIGRANHETFLRRLVENFKAFLSINIFAKHS